MTNLDSILKSRGFTEPTNVCVVQSYGFSSYGCELDHKED